MTIFFFLFFKEKKIQTVFTFTRVWQTGRYELDRDQGYLGVSVRVGLTRAAAKK